MLPSWVTFCTIGDHAVFLDIRNNRYCALPAATAIQLTSSKPRLTPAVEQRLARLGWLKHAGDGETASSHVIPTMELAPAETVERPRIGTVLGIAAVIAATKLAVATAPFERVLGAVSGENVRAVAMNAAHPLNDIIARFETIERVVIGRDACLLRSLSLHRLLARAGHPTTLVFGVKLHPFEAHCWLQQGDLVLNDTLEQTGLFTAIRSVQ